jgi:hypothetical protein
MAHPNNPPIPAVKKLMDEGIGVGLFVDMLQTEELIVLASNEAHHAQL